MEQYRDRSVDGVRRLMRRALAGARARPWAVVEVLLGGLLLALVLYNPDGGTSLGLPLRIVTPIVTGGLHSLMALLWVDGMGTLHEIAFMLARLIVAFFPALLLIRAAPSYRRIWLVPLVAFLFLFSLLPSLSACATASSWLLLIVSSAAAVRLSRIRFLGWTALLPLVLLAENIPRHLIGTNPLPPAERRALYAECLKRDGALPTNLDPDKLMAYHGITVLSDDWALLTSKGERDYQTGEQDRLLAPSDASGPPATWWLHRRNGRYEYERPSEVWGNMWRGCALDGTIWMSRAEWLIGATRLLDGGEAHEKVVGVHIQADEFDFGETACDPQRNRLYVAEATRGGIWEVTADTHDIRRHQIGGRIMFPKRRFDGAIIVSSTNEVREWSPEGDVVARTPTALVSSGFDLCRVDGAVASADVVGRLRIFELDEAGHYRFAWGMSMFAPRRVAFSPDCSHLAVTSGDDRHVYIIDRASHEVVGTHLAGPALREVVATGPREFSITDICGVTTYSW